jgi:hypothetical protein
MVMRNPDNALQYWRDFADPDHSVHFARQELERMLVSTEMSIEEKLEILTANMEALLDGPGGNPMEVVKAVDQLEHEIAWRERLERPTREQRLKRRVILSVASARGWHCAGNSDRALERALAAHCIIESAAGGRERLLELLSLQEPNLIAECMSRILGILAAAMRRATELGPTARRYWPAELRALGDALMPGLDPDRAIVYPGSGSHVQYMYLLAEEGDPLDAERIRAYHRFDKRVRLADNRGLATVPLREVAVAKYFGDDETAAEQSDLAIKQLEPLERHMRAVDDNDYLA